MKYRFLSLMIPALLIGELANAAEIYNKDNSKLDLYGKIDASYGIDPTHLSISNDLSSLIFGIKGTTDLKNNIINTYYGQMTGYGKFEYSTFLSTAENEKIKDTVVRLGFVGIKNVDMGSIDYGRNYGVSHDIASWTQVLPRFGESVYSADNFLFTRGSNMLTYRDKNCIGILRNFNIAFQLQFPNNNIYRRNMDLKGPPTRHFFYENGTSVGFSGRYQFKSGVNFGGAVFSANRTPSQNSIRNNELKDIYMYINNSADVAVAYTWGLKYKVDHFYFAATFTRSYNAVHFGNSFNIYDYENFIPNLKNDDGKVDKNSRAYIIDKANRHYRYYIRHPAREHHFYFSDNVSKELSDSSLNQRSEIKNEVFDNSIMAISETNKDNHQEINKDNHQEINKDNHQEINKDNHQEINKDNHQEINKDNHQEINKDKDKNKDQDKDDDDDDKEDKNNDNGPYEYKTYNYRGADNPYGYTEGYSKEEQEREDKELEELRAYYFLTHPEKPKPFQHIRAIYGYADKADNVELVAQYQFDFGFRPSVAFVSLRGTVPAFRSQDLKKYISVGATYFVNKNFSAYVDYRINLLKKNHFNMLSGANLDNSLALGLSYQF